MIGAIEKVTISNASDRELYRSINKYGDWSDYSYYQMLWQIVKELFEVFIAIHRKDYHGPHGVFIECAQVSACVHKMMNQVLVREGKRPLERI